jgi:lipoate-protein ligase A
MHLLDLTLPTPAENLACDEALLDLCEEGGAGEVLRFWEPREYFVVVGYANKVASEVNVNACRGLVQPDGTIKEVLSSPSPPAEGGEGRGEEGRVPLGLPSPHSSVVGRGRSRSARGIPILRRCSGGGTVLQGPGCLNYSLILQIADSGPLQSVTGTNRFVMQRNQEVLAKLLGRPVQVQGFTDLTLGNLKFSGNAQRRRRHRLIFHGTFLLEFDLALVGRYLNLPSRQPDYRQSRSHQDFLTNLKLSADAIKQAMREAWGAMAPLKEVPSAAIAQLARERYSQPDWNAKF